MPGHHRVWRRSAFVVGLALGLAVGCRRPAEGVAVAPPPQDVRDAGTPDATGPHCQASGDGTIVREPPEAPEDEGLFAPSPDGACNPGVVAKVIMSKPGQPRVLTHNLAHGFDEIVVPQGYQAEIVFNPDAASHCADPSPSLQRNPERYSNRISSVQCPLPSPRK